MSKKANPFCYFHSSPEIIREAIWLYVRFSLSLRDVEELLAARGIDICHETVRHWWNRFGLIFASEIKKRRISAGKYNLWCWHVDEMYVKLNGQMVYLWRAVDHEGEVLESYVTKRRDKSAALRFFRKALNNYGSPHEVVADGLASYPAALGELGCADKQRPVRRHGNNRAENSHLPFRKRERAMKRFRTWETLQKFVSVHAQFYNHFNSQRHLYSRGNYKALRAVRQAEWQSLAA